MFRNGADKYLAVGGAVQLTFNLLLLAYGISVLIEPTIVDAPIMNLFAFLLVLGVIALVVIFFWVILHQQDCGSN